MTLNSEFCILNSQCLNLNEQKFDTDKDERENHEDAVSASIDLDSPISRVRMDGNEHSLSE